MLKKQLLILFIIFCSQHSTCIISDVIAVVKGGWQLLLIFNQIIAGHRGISGMASKYNEPDDDSKALDMMTEVNDKLNSLELYTRDKLNNIENLINGIPDEIQLQSTKTELVEFIMKTNEKWDALLVYVKQTYNDALYSDLAKTILTSIGEKLTEVRNHLTPTVKIELSDDGFFMSLARHALHQVDDLCDKGETFHHSLTRFLQTVLMTEIKAHILLVFANHYLYPEDEAWKAPCEILSQNFQAQFMRYIKVYKASLTNSELPYVRACDPENSWQRDIDFYELEGFIQQTIYRKNSWPLITRSCESVRVPKTDARPPFTISPLNDHAACRDELYGCEDLPGMVHDRTVCLWNDGPYKIRSFTGSGISVGVDTSDSCPVDDYHEDIGVKIYDDEGTFCNCQCRTGRWMIALRPVYSKQTDNYVIVGMRISKLLNIFYIEIAEGKLESNGHISNFSWVSVDRMLHEEPHRPHEMKNVHMFRRVFFFADLQLPPAYVLTGVNFILTMQNRIPGFSIEIHGVKFDYTTGKLDLMDAQTVTYTGSEIERQLVYMAQSSVSIEPFERQRPDSRGHTLIVLKQSDLDSDFGQSTLPFFDGVPVVTNPPSPIGGVGLFHKGDTGHAGFLSLRTYPIDYLHFLAITLQTFDFNQLSEWND